MTWDCVNSIYSHVKNIPFEVILVDNGSKKDHTLIYNGNHPSLSLVQLKENVGFAKGNNFGIQKAKGRYILLLNNDTLLTTDCVSPVLNHLKKNKNIGAATCSLKFPNGSLQHNCQRFPSLKYKLLELFRIQKILGKRKGGKLLLGSFFDHKEFTHPDWVWGTFFMFPRKILSQFKRRKLPETFFMYWEDVQWCKEIKKMGYKISYIPDSSIIHLMGGSGGDKPQLMSANEKKFMTMYYTSLERRLIHLLEKILVK